MHLYLCDFIWKKRLCRYNQVKYLEMGRSSRITWVGHKPRHHQCPYRKEAEGDQTHGRGESVMRVEEADTGAVQRQAKKCL